MAICEVEPSVIIQMEMEGAGTRKVALTWKKKEDIYFNIEVVVVINAGKSLLGSGFSFFL